MQTSNRHAVFLSISLLAVASLGLLIFPLAVEDANLELNIQTLPHVFLDQDSQVVIYQLGRLSNEQLVLVQRQRELKYRLVYEALLMREGLESRYRHEAISALVELNQTDTTSQILSALDAAGGQSAVVQELSYMLLMRKPEELVRAQRLLEKVAVKGEAAEVRAAGFAAIILSAPSERVWELASASGQRLEDFLRALPMIPEQLKRDAFYDKVISLLDLAIVPQVRRAVIEVLPFFSGHDQQLFRRLAHLVRKGIEHHTAVRAIQRIDQRNWPQDEISSLAESVLRHVSAVPTEERTSSSFLDSLQLGNALALRMDVERGGQIRSQLDDLGVAVFVIRTVRNQMLYDRRQVVVEAGRQVELVFENQDYMPHNLVLTLPGARQEIGRIAENMNAEADSQGRFYVPASPKVLQATGLLEPGQIQKLSFLAPDLAGYYPYLCTFSGHWQRMYGFLVVVDSLDEYLKSPTATAPELELTEWNLDSLEADLTRVEPVRSAQGQELFFSAGCSKCHRVGGIGNDFGPDLTEIFRRWQGSSTEVLREILEPSRTIEEKYRNYLLVLTNGTVATGILTKENEHFLTVQSGPDTGLARNIDKRDIFQRRQMEMSVMPLGLLDSLQKNQILDLMSFLKYGRSNGAVR